MVRYTVYRIVPYASTDDQRAYQRDWARKRNARQRALKAELKAGGCVVCGEKELCCLSFHHRDPAQKSFGIGSQKQRFRTEEAIRAEAAKCDVLCHNCHAKTHAGLI